ncbi:MAG TPA: peptidase MA family metallohydrolase [Candidatus Limnocylindrales bacterium]|nr:peptidase MA family metallohydrolase [Candidatus Limnocylindrales bacterium]
MARVARPALAALLVAASLVASLLVPATALAADITFSGSSADATWAERIDFEVDVASAAPIARAELRLGFPDALGPLIVDVPVGAATGTQTLRYTLDLTGGGHLVPNTPISYTWAAFPEVGADPVLSSTERIRYRDTTHEWRTLKGDLVVVHWYAGSEAFARKAVEIGDAAVRDTASLLGVTETEPVDFFIYGDEESFREALGPGTRENVGGQAHADIRTLFALITPDAIDDPWVGIVVPHELVHLVFDTAVENPYRFPPRWVNEGLAVYLSEGYGPGDRNRVADAVASRDLIPLQALGGQFPADPDKTFLAYAESVSAIDYLVSTHGRDAMVSLVLAYKAGLTDDEAFTKAIGQDLATFQAGWLGSLGAEPPERFGPQPAPPGPLPSGWSGPAPTAGTGLPVSSAPPGAVTTDPTAQPDPAAGDPASAAGAMPLLLGGLGLVVLAVVGGLVLAKRRGRPA